MGGVSRGEKKHRMFGPNNVIWEIWRGGCDAEGEGEETKEML